MTYPTKAEILDAIARGEAQLTLPASITPDGVWPELTVNQPTTIDRSARDA